MTYDIEQWKPVVGWEGLYEVSNRGNVRSLDRIDRRGILRRGRMLKPFALDTGHLRVRVSRDGVNSGPLIHRLVLEAFKGSCPEGMEGCHNDGNPTNNDVNNLRWATRSENQLDSVKHGTHQWARRTHCPRGHVLAEPNLVPSDYEKGSRSCLACSRAKSIARINRRPFSAAEADDYYRRIMEVAA